ncbi:DinB family protein [Actinoplanes sp. NPDC051861]|uniref:DinB family protein n=1 Tax=Actinoplanes sp. NPDC051861 TaxID=3155170 RepID=UPI00344AE678
MEAEIDWNRRLADQWEWHWENQIKPRLAGLTDEEYLWEPAPGSWNVRGPRAIDWEFPQPVPPPVTTIAWRLAHVIVGVLAMRNASHFGAPPAAYETWEYATTAAGALDQLETQLAIWREGVRTAELEKRLGDTEPYPELTIADLILHIHRELIHHMSEVSLLRDLYQHTQVKNGDNA